LVRSRGSQRIAGRRQTTTSGLDADAGRIHGSAGVPPTLTPEPQLIWSVRGGVPSGDEELSFCGMLRNGSRHSPKSTSHTPAHSRR
jgi:hypothetical protein